MVVIAVLLALAYATWCNTYDNSLNLGQIIRTAHKQILIEASNTNFLSPALHYCSRLQARGRIGFL